MDIQNTLVYITVGLCILYMCKYFFKTMKRGKEKSNNCGCGCSGCKIASSNKCNEKKNKKN